MILSSLDNGIEAGAGAFTVTLDIPYIPCGAHLCHLKPAARFKCAPGSAPANRAPGFGNLPVAWISLVPDSRSTKRQGLILDFLVSLDTLNITQPPRLCLLQLLIKDVTMELNAGPSEFGGTYIDIHRHP